MFLDHVARFFSWTIAHLYGLLPHFRLHFFYLLQLQLHASLFFQTWNAFGEELQFSASGQFFLYFLGSVHVDIPHVLISLRSLVSWFSVVLFLVMKITFAFPPFFFSFLE